MAARYVRVENAQPDPKVSARQQERWLLTLMQLDDIQQKARRKETLALAEEIVASILFGQDPSDTTLLRITGLWYDAHDEAEGREPRSTATLLRPNMARLGIESTDPIPANSAGAHVLSRPVSSVLLPIDLIIPDRLAAAFVISSIFCASARSGAMMTTRAARCPMNRDGIGVPLNPRTEQGLLNAIRIET